MPPEGVVKPGGPGPHQVNARIRQAGEAAGINFTGLCPKAPNTVSAHALLTHALEKGGWRAQNSLQEVIFRMYYTDGIFPDVDNLTAAAVEVGLDGEEAHQALVSGRYNARVSAEASRASQEGVTGVPYFYVNGKPCFSGAQPVETMIQTLMSS
eukprot:NODE_16134_length_1010_cov_4.861835.p1 GENE.NODE_16134_length_1010_cov_4.861835~~NODE_16134_length_1010_cov_4.861835.p1  ORF type:complete len:154 (-),score=35.68 NODE_16134_length_1010_cov_4.861835:313-774(-)